MKLKLAVLFTIGCLLTGDLLAQSQPAGAIAGGTPSAAATEMRAVFTKIQTKLKVGQKTEADLADELKDLSVLVEKYRADQSEEAAQLLMMQASLYAQVLGNEAKGKELRARVQTEFPNSKVAAAIKGQEKAEQVRAGLVAGAAFPEFTAKDTEGKTVSLASYKGKVVLIDFWATWCGPCVAELPHVLKTYEKHHAAGFEVIGISLDRDEKKLADFVKQKAMTWPQIFQEASALAQQFGVVSIPTTYLIDAEGKIIGSGYRGDKLEEAVAAALAKK